MIDLHCHILPGIDDGPTSLGEAIALARAAVAAGTEAIVATPHVSRHYPGTTAALVADGVTRLQASLDEAGIPLILHTGAEVAMTQAMELDDDELVALRLGGPEGTYLLLECPLSFSADGFDRVTNALKDRGHKLLLAHPERCPAFHRDPAAYEALIAAGALGQVTAGALVGRFGRTVQRSGERLLRSGVVHVVASDAHSALRRPPSIRPELEAAGFGAQAEWLGVEVPWALLSGAALPPFRATGSLRDRLLRSRRPS